MVYVFEFGESYEFNLKQTVFLKKYILHNKENPDLDMPVIVEIYKVRYTRPPLYVGFIDIREGKSIHVFVDTNYKRLRREMMEWLNNYAREYMYELKEIRK